MSSWNKLELIGSRPSVTNRHCTSSGRDEVRWFQGQEASLAPPCSNLTSFGSKYTVLKKVLVTLLWLFGAPAAIRRPHSGSSPGELCTPCPPRYAPARHTFLDAAAASKLDGGMLQFRGNCRCSLNRFFLPTWRTSIRGKFAINQGSTNAFWRHPKK